MGKRGKNQKKEPRQSQDRSAVQGQDKADMIEPQPEMAMAGGSEPTSRKRQKKLGHN